MEMAEPVVLVVVVLEHTVVVEQADTLAVVQVADLQARGVPVQEEVHITRDHWFHAHPEQDQVMVR
jgi:hypothetical protein